MITDTVWEDYCVWGQCGRATAQTHARAAPRLPACAATTPRPDGDGRYEIVSRRKPRRYEILGAAGVVDSRRPISWLPLLCTQLVFL